MAGRILVRGCIRRKILMQFLPYGCDNSIAFGLQVLHKRRKYGFPKLTPQQVNTILRAQEHSVEIGNPSSVKSFDTNQLPSNNPVEDRRAEAKCLLTTGTLFGIFDGHAGSACAEVVSQRLFYYVAVSLLPNELLRDYLNSVTSGGKMELLKMYNNDVVFESVLGELYQQSFIQFVKELASANTREFVMTEALAQAFLRLDEDLSHEAQTKSNAAVRSDTLAVAASGAVACVAHLDGPHLHIASVGDCQAVLGSLDESNTWVPRHLTREHNSDNTDEVKRLLSEHPSNEAETIIVHDRLLGQLAPLRAFGDYRYKWKLSLLKELLVPIFGHQGLPMNYYTPPYLTARPEVTYHRLMPRDRFLVIASDGLWEQLAAPKVVRLVGEYMSGLQTLDPLKLPNKNMKLRDVNDLLLQRKEGLKNKPLDTNAATHLIRNALGGTEYGVEHSMLSQMLCVPDDVVRLIRDDITLNVIFFDDDYLRHCPA